MILEVDIGNTRLKWRLMDGAESTSTVQAVAVRDWETIEQQWRQLHSVQRVRVACVAPSAVRDRCRQACGKVFNLAPEFAAVEQGRAGVTVAYQDYSSLGVDRWLALLASRHQFPGMSCLVISAGTALTIDLLSHEGNHLGGYIVPGLKTATEALFGATSVIRVPSLALTPAWQPGATTLECVENGFAAMYQGLLRSLWQQASEQLREPLVVWSGGDAETVAALLGDSARQATCPSLVLDGLRLALP